MSIDYNNGMPINFKYDGHSRFIISNCLWDILVYDPKITKNVIKLDLIWVEFSTPEYTLFQYTIK